MPSNVPFIWLERPGYSSLLVSPHHASHQFCETLDVASRRNVADGKWNRSWRSGLYVPGPDEPMHLTG